MGGSSLWPHVLGATFAPVASSDTPVAADRDVDGADGGEGRGRKRDLIVLDTTVPAALEATLGRLDLERCLVILASKSGSTIEPNAIGELLFERLCAKIGAEAAGRRFVAITDPGSVLEARAEALGFLGVAHGSPDVGGRFSALSPFGMLPAEAIGLDPEALQARARRMVAACASFVPPERNPGVRLGLSLGVLSRQGRDKLTLTAAKGIESFLGWIDQLVAESTGKRGLGMTPIVGESLPSPSEGPSEANTDRVFVDFGLDDEPTPSAREEALAALESAGQPVIRIRLASRLDLVQEVYRWQIATAVLASTWGVNPFDQPDVDAAKEKARALMAAPTHAGETISPDLEVEGLAFFAPPALADVLAGTRDPVDWMRASLASLGERDVFALNVFLEERDAILEPLRELRAAVGNTRGNATTLAVGPRYLHSSGQLQKGGPNLMVGLQIWQGAGKRAGDALEIPSLGGDFDRLCEAQAVGDFAVLAERGRRVIGIDVGSDPPAAVRRLLRWVQEALA